MKSIYSYDNESNQYVGTVRIDSVTYEDVGFYYCVKSVRKLERSNVKMCRMWEKVCNKFIWLPDKIWIKKNTAEVDKMFFLAFTTRRMTTQPIKSGLREDQRREYMFLLKVHSSI